MRPIDMKPEEEKYLGRLGENETRSLKFWVGDILSRFPEAQITLLHQRAGETSAYPVADAVVEGKFVVWTIRSEDVAIPGEGICSLTATDNGKVIKTERWITVTDDALDSSTEVPEPYQGWVDSVLAAAESARDSADESATNVSHYPKIENGYWTVWDAQNETWVSTGVRAQGETGVTGEQGIPGENGFSPSVSVRKSGGTATIAIMDESGTTETEISDGFSPSVSVSKEEGTTTITITDESGTTEAEILDGFSPSASVSKEEGTATITITDENGTTEAEVSDGIDGQDGFTPSASVSKSGRTATITITDANGTTTAEITDGLNGTNGKDGADGYSPFAGVEKHGKVATVTVIDKRGTSEVRLYDGEDGAEGPIGPAGPGVAAGGTAGQVLRKHSETDYDTEWADRDPVETVTGSTPIIQAVSGTRYICGEVSELLVDLPASGDVEIMFESGATAAELVLTPPSGVASVKWPAWFDPDHLEPNCTYDMIITNGKYGVVMLWA